MSLVLSQVDGFVGTVTLNHPEKRNALSEHLVEGIIAAFEDFKARNVRVVVLRALPGSRVWSAGHNVEELPAAGRDPLGWDDPLRNLIRQIESFPGPVVAMIENHRSGLVWRTMRKNPHIVRGLKAAGFTGGWLDSTTVR